MRIVRGAICTLTVVAAAARATPQEYGEAMYQLASERGCMTCHGLLPSPKRTDGLPPIAPPWREIAARYRDDPGASERLTRTVLAGSNPASRHWAGKVSDVTMPPNAGVVTEAEARALVNWLLVQVP